MLGWPVILYGTSIREQARWIYTCCSGCQNENVKGHAIFYSEGIDWPRGESTHTRRGSKADRVNSTLERQTQEIFLAIDRPCFILSYDCLWIVHFSKIYDVLGFQVRYHWKINIEVVVLNTYQVSQAVICCLSKIITACFYLLDQRLTKSKWPLVLILEHFIKDACWNEILLLCAFHFMNALGLFCFYMILLVYFIDLVC